jgi:hypothetical protein
MPDNGNRSRTALERFAGNLRGLLPPPDIGTTGIPYKAVLSGAPIAEAITAKQAGAGYVAGALLFLVTAIHRKFKRDRAEKLTSTLFDKALDMVDPEILIKKQLPGVSVVVLKEKKDLKTLWTAMAKAQVPPKDRKSATHSASIAVREAQAGNGFAFTVPGVIEPVYAIIVPPRVPRALLAHEIGHIKSARMGGTPLSIDVSDRRAAMGRFASRISKLYDERTKLGTVAEEERAWDLAGIPKDNPWRKASVETYRSHHEMTRALIRLGALSSIPIIAAMVMVLKGRGDK